MTEISAIKVAVPRMLEQVVDNGGTKFHVVALHVW